MWIYLSDKYLFSNSNVSGRQLDMTAFLVSETGDRCLHVLVLRHRSACVVLSVRRGVET